MAYHLAQFNIARLIEPLDAEESGEFVRALEPINMLADVTPGFVWRLKGEDGQPSSFMSFPEIDDSMMLVNYSIWTDLESFTHFVYRSGHGAYFRRRREWFAPSDQEQTVCWWVPAGEIPPASEGYERLMYLRQHGPSERGWPPNKPFDPPTT
jgi:Domain of unknown function (DUF3291)